MPRKPAKPVDPLVVETKRLERAAGKKVYRLEKKGNRIRRDELDPRVGARNVESMSPADLVAHGNKLRQFIDRSTQFVPGIIGTPLPKAKVDEFVALQKRNNALVEAREAQVSAKGDIPGQDQTGVERRRMLSDSRKTGVSGPLFQKSFTAPGFITTPKELDRLIEKMRQRVAPDFLEKSIGRRLNSVEAVLKNVGSQGLMEEIRGLTPEQQNTLIDYTTFMDVARDRFESPPNQVRERDSMDRDYELRYGTSKQEDYHVKMQEIIAWVKEHPAGDASAIEPTTKSTAKRSPFLKGNASSRRRKK